ncbi:PKD domain-containing protein [Bacteroidota bacterium]
MPSSLTNRISTSRVLKDALLIFLLFLGPINFIYPEGSNEVWVDKPNNETHLYLCNQFGNQCNGGGSGIRTQFAIYNCNEEDRLYFEVLNTDEVVYLGFNGDPDANNSKIVYRIKNLAGTIVYGEFDLPTSGTGFINNIGEARAGPFQVAGAGGYDGILFTPPSPGKYYVEFDRVYNNSGNTNPGAWYINLFDVTVFDNSSSEVKTGRLHAKNWQFYDGYQWPNWRKNSSTFYIYSTDSVVTSVEYDDMEGRAWIMFCNSFGCANTGNFPQDRKSLAFTQAYVPEYKIFLNEPDPDLFPTAPTLGLIIPPEPYGVENCDGTITFFVNVDKGGNVGLELVIAAPYVNRLITTQVSAGVNQITWNGYDGAGTPVPNNTAMSFTVTFINGLTNLPLYDIEENVNGFRIELVSPTGPTPLVYWDDTNINGGGTNFAGCNSVPPNPGCHNWNNDFGDLHTINTWWYSAATSTAPVNITEVRRSQLMTFVQSLPQNHCTGETRFFSVDPEPNTDTYYWNFTGTDFVIHHNNPSDPYITIDFGPNATSGDIEVYGTNSNCPDPGDTARLFVTITETPDINLGPDTTICNNGSNTAYFDAGAGYQSYNWNTGDHTQVITPSTPGEYYVDVNNFGCLGSDTVYLTVFFTADADAGTDESICQGEAFNFATSATIPSALNADSIKWFGGTGSFIDPTVMLPVYNANINEVGPVQLNMVAYGHPPCGNDTSFMILTVDTIPSGDFSSQPIDTCCVSEQVDFFGTSMSDIVNWDWEFGDGNTGNGQNVQHSYSNPGTYTVSLIIENLQGCKDTIEYDRTVVIVNPNFTITSDPSCNRDTVFFRGSGNATFTDWNWDFGDGNVAQGKNVWHIYTVANTYNVTLNVCSETAVNTLTVHPDPELDAGTDESVCATAPFDFTNSNIPPTASNYDIVEWYGGSGFFDNPNVIVPVYNPGAGEYGPVTLYMVAHGLGPCLNDTSFMLLTVDTLPIPDYTRIPFDNICVDEPISFDASSTTDISLWTWDFDDGNTTTGQNVIHSFSQNGIFNVKLIVTNIYGCQDSIVYPLTINENPVVDFTILPNDTICAEELLSFNGSATTNIVTWDWDFGDGNTSALQNPTHTYMATGTYPVTLSVVDDNSCFGDTTKNVFIYALPVADFSISPNDTSCVGEMISFAGNGTTDIVDWQWDFGDGNTGNGQNITHTYTSGGNYTIALYYTNSNGCMDTATHLRTVIDLNIDFSMVLSPSCENSIVSFNGTSNVPATFTSWNWDFGDGNSGIGHDVTHTFAVADTYNIVLDVCSEQLTRQLIIYPHAINNAGSDEATCEDVFFDFNTSTILPTASGYDYVEWTGGAGWFDDPNAVVPVYNPGATETGLVTLTMIAYAYNPCDNDTSTMVLNVVPGAYAFAGSDTQSCEDDPFDFSDCAVTPFATNYANLSWSHNGTGNFVNPNVEVPVYIPGPGELGDITMTMLATNILNCDSIDEMVLSIYRKYYTPTFLTICYGDSIFVEGQWRFTSGLFHDTLMSVNNCDSIIGTNLTVLPKIDIDFTIGPRDTACIGELTTLTMIGSANLTSWLWDLGDGTTSTDQNPTISYTAPGTYVVTLSYTDDVGCSDSTVHNVYVYYPPDIHFTSNVSSSCINAVTNFFGQSNSNIALWEWDFGDGATATGQNVSHIYTVYGLFYVTLVVTDIQGCTDTLTKSNFVVEPPDANFDYYVIQCDTLQFINTSTAPPGYYIVESWWDFGDGTTSTLNDPWHVFPSGGVFDVKLLVAADSMGYICYDSIVLPVVVPGLPTIYYTWTPEPTCIGDDTWFFGTSGNSITEWYWDFDDGYFTTGQDVIHQFAAAGTYDVLMRIQDVNGCWDTLSHEVTVAPNPDVSFTMSANPGCVDAIIDFTGLSTTATGWMWDFGDGALATTQNPQHVYTQGGVYTVTLTVSDTNQCDNVLSQSLTINELPVVDFSPSVPACDGDPVVFTDYSVSPGGSITRWLWDFGDGSTIVVNSPDNPDVSHQYASGGSYNVSLTALDTDSCENTRTKTVVVESSPIAGFNQINACQGEPVQFTDLSSVNGGGNIVSWYWEFGDPNSGVNNTSAVQHPIHLFMGPTDTYDVQLIIENAGGCTDTITKEITLDLLPDVSYSTDSDTTCMNALMNFYGQSSSGTNYFWDFGDGGTSTQQSPQHLYASAGSYNISLTVTGAGNCENTATGIAYVSPEPVASFESNTPMCSGFPVQFTDLSNPMFGYIQQWYYTFGDGQDTTIFYPNNPNLGHVYDVPGTYTVQLVITNSSDCRDSISQTVTISQGPEANFVHQDNNCAGSTIQFTDSTLTFGTTIQSWYWTFGDPTSGAGNISTMQHPQHVFSSPGQYTVTLQVTTQGGCIDTITKQVDITPEPPVYFTVDPPQSCYTDITYFVTDPDTTNIPEVQSFFWEFDDPGSGANGTSTLQDPTHVFSAPGLYHVSLTIEDINGCENLITRTVQVNNKPLADYDYTKACLNDSSLFFDQSISTGSGVVSWHWDFDDPSTTPNDTSNLQNPGHVFSGLGTYNVSLIVSDQSGCSDTIVKTVIVFDKPAAGFTYVTQCSPAGMVHFTDSSFSGTSGSPVQEWLWELEPGYYSSEVNPQYQFPVPDSCYLVHLMVTDGNGCSDTITRDVCVQDALSVSMSANRVCLNDTTFFSGVYSPITDTISQWRWDYGDGNSEITTLGNASHLYQQAGTYYATLEIEDSLGCTTTDIFTVVVDQPPQPDFTATTTSCTDPTQFTDLSNGGGSLIVSWGWDFGDGTTSTLQNPLHLYPQIDTTYNVTLTLTNQMGCVDSITKPVDKGLCMVAQFEATTSNICNDLDVCFTDSSYVYQDAYPIFGWHWDFGDGQTMDYGQKLDSVCHSYNQTGQYDVMLVITVKVNGVDSYDTTYRTIGVSPRPIANFTDIHYCKTRPTRFSDISQPNGSTITAWSWVFGDPTVTTDTSSKQNPMYTYNTAGTYDVQLIVTNTGGCSDTIDKQIEIFNNPTADFLNLTACAGDPTLFEDQSTAPGANMYSWYWIFGDTLSHHNTSLKEKPAHVYDSAGFYNVFFRVTDDNLCQDSLIKQIEVYPIPTAGFTIIENYQSLQGQVLFDNQSTDGDAYDWDFGDGNYSSDVSPVYTYSEDGTYEVILIAWNTYNCPDTTTRIYEILLQGLYVPNAFVPDDDNLDLRVFKPVGKNLISYSLEIFSAWGHRIWSSTQLDSNGSPVEGWDGTYDGELMPQGTYTWKASGKFVDGTYWQGMPDKDGKIKPYGTVTVIR